MSDKKIREMTEEERNRAKERDEANNKKPEELEFWPDNPSEAYAI